MPVVLSLKTEFSGNTEPLEHVLTSAWSRRIDEVNELIYVADGRSGTVCRPLAMTDVYWSVKYRDMAVSIPVFTHEFRADNSDYVKPKRLYAPSPHLVRIRKLLTSCPTGN